MATCSPMPIFRETSSRATVVPRITEIRSNSINAGFCCVVLFNVDVHLRGFRNSYGFTLLFELPDKIQIEIREWLDTFPRKESVVTRGDAVHRETAILIGGCSFVEIKPVPKPIGNQNRLNTALR